MRSNLVPIDQLLMCMSKSRPGDCDPTLIPTIVKVEQYQTSSPETSRASCDDNEIIAFGPIKVKPRKKPAPTLATGRRSKYEILSPAEEQKRHVRRARNRAAAERVRLSRLNIEQQLLEQINTLEQQEQQLSNDVEILQHQKLNLETRLLTHEQMCSNVTVSNDFTSYLPLDNIPVPSVQENDKLPDFNLDDLFFNSLTNEQIQQNYPEALTSLVLTDDLNFLMDTY